MLVIVLLKGVPARTTQAAQIGGVLNREAMDLVLNPHDAKAVEAADYLKRRAGGKMVALTMGPDMKLIPLMKPLYAAEATGMDEEYVLSDRKMAGGDTLATSYVVALGVKKVVELHVQALEVLADEIRKSGRSDKVKERAAELYRSNLIPNRVYSELPSFRDTTVARLMAGEASPEETLAEIEREKGRASEFVVLAGVKTTDGETGSVGPQVAEGVSELTGTVVPHATYVEDFDYDPSTGTLTSQRMIGYLSQRLEMRLPALLTISSGYRPRTPPASAMDEVRANSYRGKVLQPTKWTAEDIGADPKKIGLINSPTIVGTGIDIGKPPVQKTVGVSRVFTRDVAALDVDGKKFGPFSKGDLSPDGPRALLSKLEADGALKVFDVKLLAEELTA